MRSGLVTSRSAACESHYASSCSEMTPAPEPTLLTKPCHIKNALYAHAEWIMRSFVRNHLVSMAEIRKIWIKHTWCCRVRRPFNTSSARATTWAGWRWQFPSDAASYGQLIVKFLVYSVRWWTALMARISHPYIRILHLKKKTKICINIL